jgi:hypothetical protein
MAREPRGGRAETRWRDGPGSPTFAVPAPPRARNASVTRAADHELMNRRPWKRLATKRLANLRAARRRKELPPPAPDLAAEPMPPLECPHDDREFVWVWLAGTAAPLRLEPA